MLFTASVSVFSNFATLLIDKVLTGRFLGEQALAAFALFSPLFSFVFFVGAVLGLGASVCYSICIGELKNRRAGSFFTLGMLMSLVTGLVMCLFVLFGGDVLIGTLSPSDSQLPFVRDIVPGFSLIVLVIPVFTVLANMVYVDGDKLICLVSQFVLFASNIAFSVYLCGRLGIGGIVYGSVISVVLSGLVLGLHFARRKNSLRMNFKFKMRDAIKLVRYSAVDSSEYLFLSVFFFACNSYFLRNYGGDSLVSLSVVLDLLEMCIVFVGVWQAAEPVLNVYRAEHNYKAVKRMMSYVNLTLLAECVVAFALVYCCAPSIVRIFHIHTAELVAETTYAVRCFSFGILPLAFLKVYASYYLHEEPVYSVSLVGLFALVAPFSLLYVLGGVGDMHTVWLMFPLSFVLSAVVAVSVFMVAFGRSRFPFLFNRQEMRRYFMCGLLLKPENLVKLRDRVGDVCDKLEVSSSTRYKLMLLVEELGMLSYSMNAKKRVYAEFSFCVKDDSVYVTYKDDGVVVDMTDLEQKMTDLRAYLVTSFMAGQSAKNYVLTLSFNRHVFKFAR